MTEFHENVDMQQMPFPKEHVSEKHAAIIYDNRNGLSKWSAYEKPIDRVLGRTQG